MTKMRPDLAGADPALPSSLHDGRIEPIGLPHFFPLDGNDGIIGAEFWPTDGYSTNFYTVIYRTHDGGLNWQPTTPVDTGCVELHHGPEGLDLESRPHSTGSTAPVKGILYRTDDRGTSWRPVKAVQSLEEYLTHGEDIVRLDFVDDEYAGRLLGRAQPDPASEIHRRRTTWTKLR